MTVTNCFWYAVKSITQTTWNWPPEGSDNGSFSLRIIVLGWGEFVNLVLQMPMVFPRVIPPPPRMAVDKCISIYEVVRVAINRVLVCLRPRKTKTDKLTKGGRGSRLNSTKYRHSRWGRCSGSKSTKTRRARWTKSSRIWNLANSKVSKCWSRTWRCAKREPTTRWRLAGRTKQCHDRFKELTQLSSDWDVADPADRGSLHGVEPAN